MPKVRPVVGAAAPRGEKNDKIKHILNSINVSD